VELGESEGTLTPALSRCAGEGVRGRRGRRAVGGGVARVSTRHGGLHRATRGVRPGVPRRDGVSVFAGDSRATPVTFDGAGLCASGAHTRGWGVLLGVGGCPGRLSVCCVLAVMSRPPRSVRRVLRWCVRRLVDVAALHGEAVRPRGGGFEGAARGTWRLPAAVGARFLRPRRCAPRACGTDVGEHGPRRVGVCSGGWHGEWRWGQSDGTVRAGLLRYCPHTTENSFSAPRQRAGDRDRCPRSARSRLPPSQPGRALRQTVR